MTILNNDYASITWDNIEIAKKRLRSTQFLVKATNFEWLQLWERHHANVVNWVQDNGTTVIVGSLNNRPITIQLNWDYLNGFLVCHWCPISELVDHHIICEWLDRNFSKKTKNGRKAECDAMNFHQCLNEVAQWTADN